MNKPNEWEEMKVPKLCPHVKKKNGVSSQRLAECIDALDDHLEEQDVQEDASEHRASTDTE